MYRFVVVVVVRPHVLWKASCSFLLRQENHFLPKKYISALEGWYTYFDATNFNDGIHFLETNEGHFGELYFMEKKRMGNIRLHLLSRKNTRREMIERKQVDI